MDELLGEYGSLIIEVIAASFLIAAVGSILFPEFNVLVKSIFDNLL